VKGVRQNLLIFNAMFVRVLFYHALLYIILCMKVDQFISNCYQKEQ